jgi:2-polyprenyl-3-methyl-5-hydroxy-6-metoxy-1,4-benzoquinol methylase
MNIFKEAHLFSKPDINDPNIATLYHALWSDDHISKGMLESHLNPDKDGATSNHAFVAKSAAWIAAIAPPQTHRNLLDLGCGPGVYAERFAGEGYNVTGVDYSRRSLDYAKEQTVINKSNIEYHYQNYLTIDYNEQFDIVTIINKDYPVLSHSGRITLLSKIYKALKPNGMFIFDTLTPKMREPEHKTWRYNGNGGFCSADPHLLLEAVYQYNDADQTQITKTIVITDNETKCYICPYHFFTKEKIISEVEPVGFTKGAFYGDIAGSAYSDDGETICAVYLK